MNRLLIKFPLIIFLVFLTFLASIVNVQAPKVSQGFILKTTGDIQNYLSVILDNIDIDAIKSHVEYLSSLETRMTGYPGCEAAANYIYNKFLEFGIDKIGKVYKDSYYQPAPIDYGAKIEILSPVSKSLKIYPLLPNVVAAPSIPGEGLVGRLIYAGSCSLNELNGKPLNGSIILADFNSLQDWIIPFMFGAKAVIFIEPGFTNSYQASLKTLAVPANIPRFYIKKNDALTLLSLNPNEQEVIVKLTSKMVWENRLAYNVIGIINGTVNPEQIIQVWAHYDSTSVVPSVAPGADEATGIAVMLEMARFFSKHRPGRTIMFVALSGHWQCVAGARYHVWKYFWGGDAKKVGAEQTILTMGLDLSTDSEYFAFYFGALPAGYPSLYGVDRHDWYDIREALNPIFYWGKPLEEYRLKEWKEKGLIAEDIRDESLIYYMVKNTGRSYLVSDGMSGMGYGQQGSPTNLFAVPISILYLDTEPAAMAGSVAFSLRTSLSFRSLWGTPLDTIDRVDFTRLRPQAEVAFASVFLYANLEGLENVIPAPKLYWDPVQARGFSVARINVVKYDFLTGRYAPVENAVVLAQISRGFGHTSFSGAGHVISGMTDKNGSLTIYGFRGAHGGTELRYWLEAYVVDPETGNLVCAPDGGRYGARVYDPRVFPDMPEKEYTTAVFECGQIAILGIIDIRDQSSSRIGFIINEIGSHAETLNFGSTGRYAGAAPYNPWAMGAGGTTSEIASPVHVVYVPPNHDVEILVYSGQDLVGVLNNRGEGFNLKLGELLIIPAPMEVVRDLHKLNEERLGIANSYYLFSGNLRAETFHAKARENLMEAELMLSPEVLNYEKAYSDLMFAWSNEYIAYVETRKLYNEAIISFTFFLFLLVPFALFIERLFEHRKGTRRIITIVVVAAAFLAFMAFSHPGMRLASNAVMVIFGSVALIMIVPILFVVLSETKYHLDAMKREILGEHFSRMSKTSAAFLAFSMASSNLKKRPMRSILTLITLIVIVSSLVAFTSAYFYSGMRIAPSGAAPYDGLLLYKRGWTGMPLESLRLLKATVREGGVVVASGFMSPGWAGPTQTEAIRGVGKTYKDAVYRAIWGLMPEAKEIFDFEDALLPGSRWFLPEDIWAAIISDDIHGAGVEIGDRIIVFGNEFTVIGVISREAVFSFQDLNSQGITPIDYVKEAQKAKGGTAISEVPERLAGQYVIIPFKTFLSIGGPIISVSAKISNASLVSYLAETLLEMTGTDIYAGTPSGILIYRKAVAFVWAGLATVIIPLFIGGFIVLNTMLGSVYERTKEIKIYSSVGLSPTHVALIFLSESLVFALLAAVIGYISGLIMILLLQKTGQIPFGVLNYASFFVILSVSVTTIIALSSSLYPALKSSRMVTPSLERKYKLTKPKGDEWIIPLPFIIAGDEELNGFLSYLYEFLSAYKGERIGLFMVSDISLKEEVVRGVRSLSLISTVNLSPYEHGISQTVTLRAVYDASSAKYTFVLEIRRLTGMYTLWMQSNRPFIDSIRKQFLVWRGLKPEEKKRYISKKIFD
ncbi:MAG: M28 family peptidase [Candidatus Bathyarchaeia archaeon]